MNENDIAVLENMHHDAVFVQSDVRGLTYVTSADDDRVMIITDKGGKDRKAVILTVAQAYALTRELLGVLPFVGRTRERQYYERLTEKNAKKCRTGG